MYIIFDTETTGFPKSWNAPITDTDNWPRMVQIAWIIYDEFGNETKRRNCIIKPEGYIIPEETIKIHRITNERAYEEGLDLKTVLEEFSNDLKNNHYLIAHNLKFDENVVGCEFYRKGVKNNLYNIKFIDTKELTVDFCKIEGSRGYKWPSLTELHEKLFNKNFEDAHDALIDVEALARCFFELKKIGYFGYNKKFEKINFDSEINSLNLSVKKENINYSNENFVNLGVHTYYSIFEAAASAEDYCKIAVEYNQKTIGLSDFGTLSGAFNFHQKCKEKGIKPVYGIDFYVNDNIGEVVEKRYEGENFQLKVFIKNEEGYKNVNKLLFMSFDKGYYFRGRIKTDWLLENKDGLIVTTTGLRSKINHFLNLGHEEDAEKYFLKLYENFGEDLYGDIQFSKDFNQKVYNNFIIKMCDKYNVKLIITNNVLYSKEEDSQLKDILFAIGEKKSIHDIEYDINRHYYFLKSEDVYKLNFDLDFNYPNWFVNNVIEQTSFLAEKCNFKFDTETTKFPKYEPTQDVVDYFKTNDTKEIIYQLSHAKLKQRLKKSHEKGLLVLTKELYKEYEERLNYELKVIDEKGMLDYFLVLWELIRFCNENNVAIGVGRGSAGGCLLSWTLGIVDLDPIQYGLYFERFMNPERNAIPDIDFDTESGSDEITNQFLYSKYGKERVFPVITFYTFNEKGCIKDVTRALGQDTGYSSDVFAVTKEMPDKWDCTLEEWIQNYKNDEMSNQKIVKWLEKEETQDIIKNTLKLQGNIRSLGKHAAGVIITPSEVWNFIPVNMVSGEIVSGFQESGSGKDLSDLGILKLDRLNLTTLNIIKNTIEYVKENSGIDISEDVRYLDIKNKELFDELKIGFNSGIFQFESDGITSLAKGVDVDDFYEVVATTSLYRPGPMGVNAHSDYIKNKFNPDKIEYVNDKLAPLLKETKGVLIYQEQLMFIAKEVGGMTLGEGDNLRKVMDKASKIIGRANSGEELSEKEKNDKNYKEYLNLWDKFKSGALNNGYSEGELKDIEAWIVKYLGYSFNKSHAVCYSYITLQTLYLKRYYPLEFYCALLNNPKGGSDKEKHKKWLYSTIQGATSKGILIEKPTRDSSWFYTIKDGKILMGFSSINGFGEKAYQELVDKDFKNMSKDEFFNTKWTKFNKSAFEGCLKSGMFDDWSNSREELLFLKEITKATSVKKKNEMLESYKDKVFAETTKEIKDKEFYEVCEIDFTLNEKISFIQNEFRRLYKKDIKSVLNFEDPQDWYYFYIEKIDELKTKTGKPYYSILISDGGTTKKMNMWDKQYLRNKHILKEGKFFISRFTKNNDFLNFDERHEIRQASF